MATSIHAHYIAIFIVGILGKARYQRGLYRAHFNGFTLAISTFVLFVIDIFHLSVLIEILTKKGRENMSLCYLELGNYQNKDRSENYHNLKKLSDMKILKLYWVNYDFNAISV